MASITCHGLCKSFGGTRALASVDLEFPHDGVVAIVGPNGAGKTTLVDVLTGFIRPDSGSCYFDGREITSLPPHQIARIGLMRTFQPVRLIGSMTSLENILLARPNQSGERFLRALIRWGIGAEEAVNRRVAAGLLERVGLSHAAEQPCGSLSYGQQKLLALACCLAAEPRALLLDEPVAGVHAETVAQLVHLLRGLGQEGKLVVFVEHDLTFVRAIADHVVVFGGGAVVAQGPPDLVFERRDVLDTYLG